MFVLMVAIARNNCNESSWSVNRVLDGADFQPVLGPLVCHPSLKSFGFPAKTDAEIPAIEAEVCFRWDSVPFICSRM